MIDLYYAPTYNGQKAVVMLEEVGLPYNVKKIDIFAGDQHKPEFDAINPNHKIPAIVDHDFEGRGKSIIVFESAAVLQYLAEKTGKLLARSGQERYTALEWLAWQVSSVGPISGQALHFWRHKPGETYSVERYSKELDRLFLVQERRLQEVDYMAGNSYSIADIALFTYRSWFPKTRIIEALGKTGDPYPAMTRWYERIAARPAVQRALSIPELIPPPSYQRPYVGEAVVLTEKEKANLFGAKTQEAKK